MSLNIRFLGGASTVTGSKYCVEHDGKRLLVDCGLFQGYKQLRLRNWNPLPTPASEIDAVILTHAHLDHSSYVPLLVRQGYQGRIHTTAGTKALCAILLPDSGHIQEEDAFLPINTATPSMLPRCLCTPRWTQSTAYVISMWKHGTTGLNPSLGGRRCFRQQVIFWVRRVCCSRWLVDESCFQGI